MVLRIAATEPAAQFSCQDRAQLIAAFRVATSDLIWVLNASVPSSVRNEVQTDRKPSLTVRVAKPDVGGAFGEIWGVGASHRRFQNPDRHKRD